jgi:putative aldouronate transport system substrate-binding protein
MPVNIFFKEFDMKRLLFSAALLALGLSFVFAGGRQDGASGGKPVTLEWFTAYDWETVHWDPVNNEFDKYVYDNVGVNLDISLGDIEKLHALIATNTLPDIVTYDAVSSERLEMENNGMLLPLEDLISQYKVDFNVVQAQKDWYRNKDGKWYTYVSHFYDIKNTEQRGTLLPGRTNVARKDIMEQLNIDPASLRTKAGVLAALEKVKAAGVTYKGLKVIPVLHLGGRLNVEGRDLALQFGADLEDRNGNLLNLQRQSEYLESLLFENEIYRRGLTSDERFTLNEARIRQLYSTGQVFLTGCTTGESYIGRKDLWASDNKALMESFGPIYGDAGKEPISYFNTTAGWSGTMITKNCKNPGKAIELLAFLTRPEISISCDASFGGINGYDLKDGYIYVKPERKAAYNADPAAFYNKYFSRVSAWMADWVWALSATPKITGDATIDDENAANEKWLKGHYYDNKLFDIIFESGSDMAGISAQIDSYWEEQYPKIVMARSPAEATRLYNEAIAQMDKMGMVRLDEWKNQQFQENKKKLGVKFGWPRNDPSWPWYGK